MLTQAFFYVIAHLPNIPLIGGALHWCFSPGAQVPDFLKPLQEFAESISSTFEQIE